jgi:hypothetical protein
MPSQSSPDYTVLVHRLDVREARGGPWLVRVYCNDEHVHSAEGGVALSTGMREAHAAIIQHLCAMIEAEEAARNAA